MRVAPPDLPDALVGETLREHWRVDATELVYAPVGFGSHHWRVVGTDGRCWFVSVDDLRPDVAAGRAELTGPLRMAAALRDAGLDFVVAPVPSGAGDVVALVGGRYGLALYPHVPGDSGFGEDGAWHDESERIAMARLLGHLHAAAVPEGAPRFSYALPHRELTETALDDAGGRWTSGPYAECAHALVRDRRTLIAALSARYDDLVAWEGAHPAPWVVTHGEPHSGNVVRRGTTAMYLVDWDTARVAPRERDLRDLVRGPDDPAWAAYSETAGDVDLRPEVAELFHAWWDLSEIGEYVRWFRGPHADTADDRTAWAGLQWSADIAKRWPGLG